MKDNMPIQPYIIEMEPNRINKKKKTRKKIQKNYPNKTKKSLQGNQLKKPD
jgi:hypothetical protein